MTAAQPERAIVPPPDPDFDLNPFLDALGAVFGGGANVVMQLSWPEVGYGVYESKVDSGKIFLHPFKRARTTGTYLSVALVGSDEDRRAFREAVNRAHVQVRSGPDSPVSYNAFDPDLQLWVAACLFFGGYDYYRRVYGEPDPVTAEKYYQHASRLATTLQVPLHRWPPTLAEFWEYWEAAQQRVRIDDTLREYLEDILAVRFLPFPLPQLIGRRMRWINIGFLPQRFRDEMQVRWTDEDERRLARILRVARVLNRLTPGPLRRLPIILNLWDMRARRRLGKRLV